MKTFCSGVQLLVFVAITLAWACAEVSDANKDPKRSKILSYALTPSLRVGRRSGGTWEANPGRDYANLMEGDYKRPLRFDEEFDKSKRTGGTNPGMWFGPRLGRVQKRNIIGLGNDYVPWTYVIIKGDGPMARQVDYTPRLGRESEEMLDDSDSMLMA